MLSKLSRVCLPHIVISVIIKRAKYASLLLSPSSTDNYSLITLIESVRYLSGDLKATILYIMLYNACENYLFADACFSACIRPRDFIKFFNYQVKDDAGSVRSVAAGRAGEEKREEIRGT